MTPAAKKTPPPVEPPPPALPAIPGVEIYYEQVTLKYGSMEMHVTRLGPDTWRLYAQLNYITVATVEWAYDETFVGDEEVAYAHATNRLKELTELKTEHDRVHDRVRLMSEGNP